MNAEEKLKIMAMCVMVLWIFSVAFVIFQSILFSFLLTLGLTSIFCADFFDNTGREFEDETKQ